MQILICLDKSLSTEKVLVAAKLITGTYDRVSVKVLHIIDETISNSNEVENHELKKALKKRSHEIKILSEVILGKRTEYMERLGSPKIAITDLLKRIHHDLVIVGSHGQSRLRNTLMGSFSELVLKQSAKPVVIVPSL